MRKGKKIISLLVFVLCFSLICSLMACINENDPSSESSGSVSASDTGTSGDTGTGDSSSSGTTPEPIDAIYLEEMPESTITTSAKAGDSTAVAAWFAEYDTAEIAAVGAGKMIFHAYVKDDTIFAEGENMYSNDGIEIIISAVKRLKGYSENTISVSVDVNANVAVKNLSTNAAVTESGITATVEKFTFDRQTVAGYLVTVEVPYAATDVSAENKDLSVAFGLTNASDAMTINSVFDTTYGVDYKNVHTFVKVTSDGFEANPYLEYGMVWGNANENLPASSVWNVDYDDNSENAHIYNTDVDNKDNYIYMRNSNLLNYYAEAKFSLKEIHNTEKWGKFGFVVTSADGAKGFFYYVDAVSADGETVNENSVNVGYNNRAGVGAWAGNYRGLASLGGTSAAYTDGNYVTLGVYRQGGAFKLFANGNLVGTVSAGIDFDEEAFVGIASFNITFDVKDYKLVTDEQTLEQYRINSVEKQNLFIGDSYIDTAFWYSYNNTFTTETSANEGVGGTRIEYWQNMVGTLNAMYKPQNIVMHIGVNDIDNGVTGEQTIVMLDKLFAMLKANFPQTEIYYVGLVHNMMFPLMWGEYDKVNAHVAELAKNDDAIHYIDMASVITADSTGSTMKWFNPDGLHYGLDGYAAFDKAICEALGVERVNSENGLGSMTVEGAPAYSYSSGWKFENGMVHNTGAAEAQLYFSNVYAADFYAEAKISIAGLTAADNFAKAGLAFRSEKGLWFWALDLAKGANSDGSYYNNGWSQVFFRPETAGAKDWNWNGCWSAFQWTYNNQYPVEYPKGTSFDYKTDKSFITLAVAKVGKDAWFISEGKVVNMLKDVFGEDEKVAAAVVNFNMEMYVKDAVTITDPDALNEKLTSMKIYRSTKTVDGDISDWSADDLTNPVVIPASDGRKVTVYATMAEDGMYVFYDVIHNNFVNSNGNWWEKTNFELKLPDNLQRFASANGLNSRWEFGTRQINAVKFVSTVENGKAHTKAEAFISYSCIDGYDRDSAYIPAGFAWKTGGETGGALLGANNDFWYVPDADPGMRNIFVTAKGIKTGTARKIDGDISDWADNTFENCHADNGQYSAFLGDDGLYMLFKITAGSIDVNRQFTADTEWHLNVNLELFGTDNTHAARIYVFGGEVYHTGWVTDAAMKYIDGETEDTLYIEFFIANEHLIGVDQTTESVKIDIGGQLYPSDNSWRPYLRNNDTVGRV